MVQTTTGSPGYGNIMWYVFRHGCAAVKIVPNTQDDDLTIGVSPLTLEPYNMDFDGDKRKKNVPDE